MERYTIHQLSILLHQTVPLPRDQIPIMIINEWREIHGECAHDLECYKEHYKNAQKLILARYTTP